METEKNNNMEELQKLVNEFGTIIAKKLPADTKFILLLAKKEGGKCATDMKEPLRSAYLRKVADSTTDKFAMIKFIEIQV
jgi:hypothetical protein